jgi:hypothetical protein
MVKKSQPVRHGKHMRMGRGWKLTAPGGQIYKGSLLYTRNGEGRIALFSVPKRV